jgi:hypothetical protein
MYCIPIAFLQKFAAGVMLLLLGVYNSEDYSLDKLDKNGKRNIILSNHSCFLDTIYFAYRSLVKYLDTPDVNFWAFLKINKVNKYISS